MKDLDPKENQMNPQESYTRGGRGVLQVCDGHNGDACAIFTADELSRLDARTVDWVQTLPNFISRLFSNRLLK